MNKQSLIGELLLALTALIWGVAFVAQRVGMDHLGPFSFNMIRTLIGCVVLMPLVLFNKKQQPTKGAVATDKKTLMLGGLCCGLCLFMGSNLQQVGLKFTSVGKAGFITALYILIVPLLGLFFGKRVRALFWIAVAVALIGIYLLTMQGALTVSLGDGLVMLSAFSYALHILSIDHFSPRCDALKLALLQFLVSAVLTAIPALLFEKISWVGIRGALIPLLYTGVLSTGAGYTMQVMAQKHVNPVVASLIMSLESVFALLAGWALLHQTLTVREMMGCVLVFASIILAQLPGKTKGIYANPNP